MPSNYTADPTVGFAPASAPDPESLPIVVLPSDGDADNGASVAQAYKQLADEVAWLKIRRAKSGSLTQAIARFQNARGQDRTHVNHQGHLLAQAVNWDQNWDEFTNAIAWPTSGNRWLATPTGVTTRAPTATAPAQQLFPTLQLAPSTANTNPVYNYRIGTCTPTDNVDLIMKWMIALDTVGANRTTILMGLIDTSGVATLTPNWGAWFSKANGDTNWQCNVSGVSPVDSGVAPTANTFVDFSIEIIGQNASDNSAGRVVFKIGNVVKADMAANVGTLATNGDPLTPVFGAKTTTTGGAQVNAYVAPVKYRQNTLLGSL